MNLFRSTQTAADGRIEIRHRHTIWFHRQKGPRRTKNQRIGEQILLRDRMVLYLHKAAGARGERVDDVTRNGVVEVQLSGGSGFSWAYQGIRIAKIAA